MYHSLPQQRKAGYGNPPGEWENSDVYHRLTQMDKRTTGSTATLVLTKSKRGKEKSINSCPLLLCVKNCTEDQDNQVLKNLPRRGPFGVRKSRVISWFQIEQSRFVAENQRQETVVAALTPHRLVWCGMLAVLHNYLRYSKYLSADQS